MEKIYQETDEKSGRYNTDSPCVSVRVFRPTLGEDGLPAIINLESGKVTYGEVKFDWSKNIMVDWNHNGAEVIRKAIKVYDAFRKRVYNLADANG